MDDIRREMERLRPVYETGVLRLLLRQNSMMYVALLRAAFDPLTGELPRETLEESFSQSLSRLVDSGEYQLREDQTIADASRRILADLTREGDDDYAWLANSHDAASHRFLYRLTARAHRAIEALSRLEDDSRTLSGAQANSIIMEIEHARMQLTADPGERVALLNREIKARKHEIRQIRHGQRQAALTESQVEDVIAVIHNTLRGVPIDLRELVLTERDNGDALRRRMQAGDMSVDDILTSYHDEYRRSFSESDSGRRFEDAFQVIITDEGRQQIFRASMTASRRCAARCAYPTRRSAVWCDSRPIPDTARCSASSTVCMPTSTPTRRRIRATMRDRTGPIPRPAGSLRCRRAPRARWYERPPRDCPYRRHRAMRPRPTCVR